MPDVRFIDKCRLCYGAVRQVLHLTPTPPANEFVKEPIEQKEYPLDLMECQDCGHVQLSCVVDPEILFRDYKYVSGTSPSFVKHFDDYAEKMITDLGLKKGSLVADIGSNDGTLLKAFKKRGMHVIGVDPAVEIAKKATEEGITTINAFFDENVAKQILEQYGKASLVCANNIFAHTENLKSFSLNVKSILAARGKFVFEVSYLKDVLDKVLFDTVYHEHLSYHHLKPLANFFGKLQMPISNVEKINTHGGSIRVYVSDGSCMSDYMATPKSKLSQLVQEEENIGEALERFPAKIDSIKNALRCRLSELKQQGNKIAAFGAPAKATSLLYHFGLDKDTIDFVVDDSPLKQGLLTPGKHIPVLPASAIYEQKPDVLVVLAWNFSKQIIEKHKDFPGLFIVPIPILKEYSTCNS